MSRFYLPVGLLSALVLLQGERPQLEASVDEDRVSVGEELTYTLRAVSHSPLPLEVTVAAFTGLEVVGRSERTEVGMGPGPVRTSLVAYRLRAVRPGHWQIGPAKVVQGADTVEAGPIVVDVAANRTPSAATLGPAPRRLLERAPPPPAGEPAVELLVSRDTVRLGEQVDVVTAAWFPRDLRMQLRRPPTLQPPVIAGVWSFPQSTPTGIAATRNVRGRWYDLFVAHQVVFPLVAGTVTVPPATLKYSTPVALQFFSQEERFALSSRPETLVVRPLPVAGRPAGFAGAIGSRLTLARQLDHALATVGEGLAVELRLSGSGNTALWPTPELSWPPNVRAYLERVDEQVASTDGQLGGTKLFRYLVVPDSAGALALPAVRYPYFDLASDAYAETGVPAATVGVERGSEPAASAALPPPLMASDRPSLAWTVIHLLPLPAWLLLIAGPPLVLWIGPRWPRLSRRRLRAAPARPTRGDLRSAEAALDELIRALAPDPDRRFGAALAAAVRAAGADNELAARVASVREHLLARRYGPHASDTEDRALASEAQDVVRRLGGSLRGWPGAAAIVLLLLCPRAAAAQNPAAEQLYESGALHAAADGFARRTEAAPTVAAHWYNLGAALYRLGEPGRAQAAWLEARRLEPRVGAIQRALELTPPPDVASARRSWSPPVTPDELLLVGLAGWVAGWLAWGIRPQVRERWALVLVLATACLLAGLALRSWYARPLAIVVRTTSLHLSPHGQSPEIAPVEEGSAVRVVTRTPGWLLVRATSGREGWVPTTALAPIGG